MADTIKTGTILIKEGALMPESLRFESEPWTFFYMAGEIIRESRNLFRSSFRNSFPALTRSPNSPVSASKRKFSSFDSRTPVHHDHALAIWRNGSSSARLNAASIAALTLTTEALVADIQEEEMKATGARRPRRRHEKKADVRMMSATGKSKSESFDFAGTLSAFRER